METRDYPRASTSASDWATSHQIPTIGAAIPVDGGFPEPEKIVTLERSCDNRDLRWVVFLRL